MENIDDKKFIENVENLIDPEEVSLLFFFQKFRKLLPKSLFKRVLLKTSKQNPYIGFVIEPYSFFLFYKLKDVEKARSLLPARYELKKSRIFADEEPEHYFGIGIFNTRATTFWGARLECYLIAEDKETGLISWIFLDVLSNTLIAMPRSGIEAPNCEKSYITTSSRGEIHLDFIEKKTGRQIKAKGSIKRGKLRKLDQPLWLMGNTSIAHIKNLSDNDDNPFAVIFDPSEVEQSLDIPVEDINVEINSLFPGLAEEEPSKVLCFPYAQHYISDSPGCRTYVKNRSAMLDYYREISNRSEMKSFSTKVIIKFFYAGMILTGIGSLLYILSLLGLV
ncbi:hypothetical protein [Spirochaeta isovalerica]|uniref:Uncharacterized protein n=1 Tax=Spirochaeta isovalerica TaxID=150 RepID=A0A841R4V0_9SPIO|nr:hypothetical protein [Spirochaeta isovalerica]MBB6478895.1 hypothetical protein [Spirochaeta isovalerica]